MEFGERLKELRTRLNYSQKEISEKTVHDLLSFEKKLGQRDWFAMIRKLNRLQRVYDDL